MFKTFELKDKKSKKFPGYVFIFFFLVIVIVLKIKLSNNVNSYIPNSRKNTAIFKRKSELIANGNEVARESKKDLPIVKIYLLEKRKKSQDLQSIGFKRNIFKNPQLNIKKAEQTPVREKKENKPQIVVPPIDLKLIGVMALSTYSSSQKNIKYAILSDNEGTYMVKKGDVLNNRYEILDIREESIKLKDIEFNRFEILILEKRSDR